ncbi:hypothetical protein I3760_02G056000 [Carya illinoinensis]|uniref:KAT8 regulatory NSL complex subunit 2 n=1 Tax=Carya illinoinensis TaxID=32201 RepID=A0A922JZJ5_CARIL|nr:hypothetical protein I3760_02G056000 [Carya illinoinensis]KAG2720907.1 hypothetical protein I3760_02G056000 [Carya illinoinensis]KAG6725945.1 hypothetical protein I3842_02G055700 [Carya illinoinensis]
MASASKHQNPSSSKPPKTPVNLNPITHTDPQDPNPSANTAAATQFFTTSEDLALSRASHLTRQQLLRRRSRYLKQLSKSYRGHYWALMEELKIKFREYYWEYGVSPFKQEQQQHVSEREIESGHLEGSGENNNNSNVNLDLKCNQRCVFVGCKLKAMPLTSFCHLHILSDSNQKLYKACGYVIKRFFTPEQEVKRLHRDPNLGKEGIKRRPYSAQAGPITCGKPILRSTIPSLCSVHFQKAQKHVTRALKKAGLNVSSSSKLAPKFHVLVAEYVRQIQAKRRALRRENRIEVLVKEEIAS